MVSSVVLFSLLCGKLKFKTASGDGVGQVGNCCLLDVGRQSPSGDRDVIYLWK